MLFRSMSSCWSDACWETKLPVGEYGPEYYSQRGEDTPPRHDNNLGEYLQNNEEYGYIYTQTEGWLCYDTCSWHETYLESQEIPSGALAV